MEYLKKIKSIILFLFLSNVLLAQSARVDSLKTILEEKASLSDTEVFCTINSLLEEYIFRGDSIQSLYYADLLIEEASKRKNPFQIKQGHYFKAYALCYVKQEQIVQSKATIDSLLSEAILAKDDLMMGLCYDFISDQYDDLSQPDSIYFYMEKAYYHLNKTNSPRIVNALWGLAYAEALKDTRNGWQKSLKWGDMALEKARKTNNPILLLKALKRKCAIEFSLENYKIIADLLLEAIDIAEKHNYVASLPECYLLLVDLSAIKKDTSNTIKYAEKAYNMAKKGDNKYDKSESALLLARFYDKFQIKTDRCEALFIEGIKMGQEASEKHLVIQGHLFYGQYYVKQEQPVLAKEQYIKGITVSETGRFHSMKLRVQAELSELLVDETNDSLDIMSFLEIDSISATDLLSNKSWTVKIHLNRAKKNKNFEKALFWSEQLREIQKLEYEANLETTIKEKLLAQEIENKKSELNLQETLVKTTTFKNKLLSAASILATLFIGILWYLFQNKKQQHRAITAKNIEISKTNRIIVEQNIEISKINTIISEKNDKISKTNTTIATLNEDLQNKNGLLQKEVTDHIAFQSGREQQLKEIKKEIDKTVDKNSHDLVHWKIIQSKFNTLLQDQDDWVIFKRKIENLYPDFFTHLALKHPDLSKREMTHCAYMLIGLSGKQVAQSLFVAPRTVETARYRIKKKIGLDKSMDLTEYVKGLNQIEDTLVL